MTGAQFGLLVSSGLWVLSRATGMRSVSPILDTTISHQENETDGQADICRNEK